MSIASEINRISQNISDSFEVITAKGVTVPSGSTSDDMAELIGEIETFDCPTFTANSNSITCDKTFADVFILQYLQSLLNNAVHSANVLSQVIELELTVNVGQSNVSISPINSARSSLLDPDGTVTPFAATAANESETFPLSLEISDAMLMPSPLP